MEKVKPVNQEADFKYDELFFSRTDEKGIILSGNEVFNNDGNLFWNVFRFKVSRYYILRISTHT